MSSNTGKKIVLTKNSLGKTEEDSSSSSTKAFPSLPLTQNRFSPLSPTYTQNSVSSPLYPRPRVSSPLYPRPPLSSLSPRPTFSSLINSPSNRTSSPSSTEYHINPNQQIIKILEPLEEQKLNQNFQTLIEYLYPKNTHFYTNDYQTREYYQAILVDSQSIVIEHNYSIKTQGHIDFSKVKILKVISPEEWSIKPYSNKTLSGYSSYPVYNYYDYQEAWFKTFLIRSFNHSWFIYFADKFEGNYPRWFLKWFKYMGAIPEIFPPQVLQGYNKYKTIFSQEYAPPFEYTLQFIIIFKLPWIMQFTYKKQEALNSSPPLLYRQYSVKWWKKIPEDQANEAAILKYHSTLIKAKAPSRESLTTTSTQIVDTNYIKRLQACASEEELQMIINEIKKFPTPSENLFQDSQDPYDDIELN